MFFNYTKLNRYAVVLSFAFIIFALYAVFNNGYGFITFFASFNIADFLMLVVIPFAALLYRAIKNKRILPLTGIYFLLIFFTFIMYILHNYADVIIFVLCALIVYIVAAIKKPFKISKMLFLLIFLISAVFILYHIFAQPPYSYNRWTAFITRGQSDPLGSGWMIIQIDNVLKTAKLFGTADFADRTGILIFDWKCTFILVNIVAHLGWAVGIAVMAAIAAFIAQLFRITAKIKNCLGFYIALSSSIMLALRFVTGILMNFGLFPITDLYIPFLSYQGSGYIVDMILLGMVLSVWRYNKIYSRAPEIKSRNILPAKIRELLSPSIKKIADYMYNIADGDSDNDKNNK